MDLLTAYDGSHRKPTYVGSSQVGPPLGGFLFALGGFATPFVLLGMALLPAAALIYYRLPPDSYRLSKEEAKMDDVPMRALLRNPQARNCILSHYDFDKDENRLTPLSSSSIGCCDCAGCHAGEF